MKINAWSVRGPKQKLTKFIYEKRFGISDVLIKIKYCSLLKADTFLGDTQYPFLCHPKIKEYTPFYKYF